MGQQAKRIAVFPGTFDPITNGHLDVIQRGRKLFDEVIIAVGDNPEKKALFSQAERIGMIREVVGDHPEVHVEGFGGLTVDFAKKVEATAIQRGIRNSTDLHFEFQVALTNRVVAGVETVFIMTSTQFAFTSSSLIRQIAAMDGDVSALVPGSVVEHMRAKRSVLPTNDHHLTEGE